MLVDPRPVDADLRLAARLREPRRTLRLAHDGGSVVAAVHRCTGVGKCVADNTGTGGVMCPSYLATRDEKDSTRGRARVLQEMVNGSLVTDGWRSDEVHEALDLCLSCKGCAVGLPDRHRHGDLQGGGAAPALPPPAPAAQPLRAGPAAPLGPARPSPSRRSPTG